MITEDYVSFEIAKLLKEKGFNESCYTYYDDIDDTINRFDEGYHFNNTSYPWGVPYDVNKAKKYIVAPTLQMAMKWLREVHELYIEVSLSCDREDKNAKIFDASIFNLQNQRYKKLSNIQGYEQTCEAAIKYSLEHLIK